MLEETGRSLIAMLPHDVNADFIKNLLKPRTGDEPTEAPAEEPRTPASPTTDPQRRSQVPNATDRQALQRAIDAGQPTQPAATRP
jgi:membrane protein required for colicin V production